jgi:hypothetical protein
MPHQDVLDGIVKHMTHVKDTGNVGRRYNDGIRFSFIRLGMKETVFHPERIPFVFNDRRVVFGGKHHLVQIGRVKLVKKGIRYWVLGFG